MSDKARKKQRRISLGEKLGRERDVSEKVACMVQRHDDHDQPTQHIH